MERFLIMSIVCLTLILLFSGCFGESANNNFENVFVFSEPTPFAVKGYDGDIEVFRYKIHDKSCGWIFIITKVKMDGVSYIFFR